MVNKKLTQKALKQISPKVTPIGKMGGEPLILPNYSGAAHHSRERLEDYRVNDLDAQTGTIEHVPSNDSDIANKKYVDDNITPHTPEGTAVKSTGEAGASKFLREDGDGTSSWQTPAAAASGLDAVYNVGDNLVTVDTDDIDFLLTSKDFIIHPADEPSSTFYKFPSIADYGNPFFEINRAGNSLFMGVKANKPLIYTSPGEALYFDSNDNIYFYGTGSGGLAGNYIKIQPSSARFISSRGYFMFQDIIRPEWTDYIDLGTSSFRWLDTHTKNLYANNSIGIGTITPDADVKLEVVGRQLFTGESSGLPYGSMYNDNTDTTVTIGTSGVAVRIPSGFTVGQTNLSTFANARELTITKAGRYKIDWSISFRMVAGSNHEIEGAIGIGGTKNAQGTAHRFIGTNTDTENMAGTAILDLADNAVISLMMENDTNTENIVVNHASLTLVQVGGT